MDLVFDARAGGAEVGSEDLLNMINPFLIFA